MIWTKQDSALPIFWPIHGIGYDQNDYNSQRCVTMAALDFVLSPLKSRRL
jgi:hypothetical protein